MKRSFPLLLMALLLLGGGCMRSPQQHYDLPDRDARKQTLLNAGGSGSQPFLLSTSPFRLYGLRPKGIQCRGRNMHLYIEGDGLSWVTRNTPSQDPTPLDPLAARLYRVDPSPCKVYLARPCQYTQDSACRQRDWTSARFSSRVIASYMQALDRLKRSYGNRDFTLIGYSGGGAVAALLAARRRDVRKLVTVAGNLDPSAWTALHGVAPLRGSLNPAYEAAALRTIPQTHLIGGADTNVPKSVYESYRKHFPDNAPIREIIYSSNTHSHGWENTWRDYLKQIR